jgi:hypothetical protein
MFGQIFRFDHRHPPSSLEIPRLHRKGAEITNVKAKGNRTTMLNLRILRRAMLVGLVLELILVAGGAVLPALLPHFLFACMMICGVAGLLYARDAALGYGRGALGGAVVGCVCALVAVAAASVLDERPELYLPLAVIVSTLTGAIGGLFGQWDRVLRRRRGL